MQGFCETLGELGFARLWKRICETLGEDLQGFTRLWERICKDSKDLRLWERIHKDL